MLIDDHGHALATNVVSPSTHQPIALRGEVGDHWRDIGVACKPRLHRVLIGGYDIRQVRRHQRAHVRGNEIIKERIGRGGDRKKKAR